MSNITELEPIPFGLVDVILEVPGSNDEDRERKTIGRPIVPTVPKPFECAYCAATFKEKRRLEIHVRTHTGEKPFKCKLCDASFTVKTSLTTHLRKHNGVKPYACEVCGTSFVDRSQLNSHRITHKEERPLKCEHCGTAFSRKQNLNAHIRIHTGEKPYKCELCGSSFAEMSTLKRHGVRHTGEKLRKTTRMPKVGHISKDEIIVPDCKFGYEGNIVCEGDKNSELNNTLPDVILSLPKNESSFAPVEESPFKCGECGANFTSKRHLKAHVVGHLSKKPCKRAICDSELAQNTERTHSARHFSKRPVKCDEAV